MAAEDNNRKWQLLSKLKSVIKKVTFLMNSNINRWRLVSAFTGGGGSRRRLSFGERFGLTAIVSSSSDDEDNPSFASSSSPELQKANSFRVERTTSFPEEDDIDKRAEMFIENFYRQLRYQKQVSLQLRYTKNASFGSSDSNSYSP